MLIQKAARVVGEKFHREMYALERAARDRQIARFVEIFVNTCMRINDCSQAVVGGRVKCGAQEGFIRRRGSR